MVDWIKIEQSDLNSLSYRKAKPEEKAILLDLIGLAMTEDIELPYNSIDNLIEYEELANLLNVKPTSLANTIRKFEKFIRIEKSDDVITLKLKFVEIAKDKISEKSSKAQNAANARWDKEREKSKTSNSECTSNANAMQTHNASNANEMQRREDKRREDKTRKEENIIIPVFSEKRTDLSANADESFNFEVNTISSFSSSENLNQELTPLKSQSLNLKPKENGSFGGELIEVKQVKPDYPDLFERLWTGYRAVAKDKAGGKQDAFKAWLKVKNRASSQDFEKAIAAYSLSKRVKEGFILNFSTFLNSGRWETELESGSELMQAEIDRAKTRALIEQLDAELEEEYKAGTRRRP
jgi:hypothetical protein